MQAYTTTGNGIDKLRTRDLPEPVAGPGQIVVQMRAAALNYRDLLVINGVEGWRPHSERIPVSDGVGNVVSVGEGVTRWKPGDRVAGLFLPHWHDGPLTAEVYKDPLGGPTVDGMLAQFVCFSQHAVVTPPAELTDAEAATLPIAALTAWHALRRARVSEGDKVLIEGTGGVSLFALQFSVALGAHTIVLSSSDEKLQQAQALGARATVNYRQTERWEDRVLEITDGAGVDQVIEVVGGENLNRALSVVRISGAISYVGLLAGTHAPIDVWRFVSRNVTLHGIETGSRSMFEEMNAFIAQHALRPVIHARYPFSAVREALSDLTAAGHFGKLVVEF